MSTPDITLLIGGLDKTSLLQVSSLNIDDDLNSNNTASFSLIDVTGAYIPAEGAAVVLTDGPTTIFAGTIHDPKTKDLSEGGNDAIIASCECVDFNEIPTRFTVQANYNTPDQTLSDVVTDLVTTCLAADGITSVNVETGPTIDPIVFTRDMSVADAFNQLADLTGYVWWIDYDKDLHFVSRETNVSPFNIVDNPPSGNFREFQAHKSRAQYRNRQFLQGGYEKTGTLNESFKGDGETETFPLKFAIAEAPTQIDVGATTYSGSQIGVRGVDDDTAEWCYKIGENTISVGNAGSVPSDGELGTATYVGQDQVMVRVQDDGKIADRVAIEGGSGIYESFESNEGINDGNQADSVAAAFLRKYGFIPTLVTYETDSAGLIAGQTQTITNAKHQVSGQFLITKVTYNDEESVILRYTVEAYDTDKMPDWKVFFAQLNRKGKKAQSQDNQSVRFGQFIDDTVNITDELTATTVTYVDAVVDVAIVGEDEVC